MAEFAEVMRQAKRMCDSGGDCYGCPFLNIDNQCKYTHLLDNDATFEDVTVFENIVMDWAAENPEPVYPTWHESWKQLFPNGQGSPCPAAYGMQYEPEFCGRDCKGCKDRPIPADIAKKLGIKPIGE